MADIKLTNLNKSYGDVHILKDVNLAINSGEFIVFVGPSGCGKSTLLRSICGLESISSGTLEIDHAVVNEVPPSKRGIAMVFQSYALYPHMSVYENISFALENQGVARDEIKTRVGKVADMLQLTPYLTRLPKALSGGQRQRVAIGRAIVRGAKVFLFDEPLSNLDAALRVATRMEIAKLKRGMPSTTMIYVTHDQVEAMTLADRIVVLQAGRVEQVGTPMELYERPGNTFVAGFIGSPKMNLITGAPAAKAKCTTLGVRPEHVDISTRASAGSMAGVVEYTEVLGSDSFVYVATEHGLITARENGRTAVKTGDKVHLTAMNGQVHRFDDNGKRIEDK
ncbi:MAG: sn-glycerol-3-phosphate ABC transporter ATP-binding protein UgpC [Rhizobiales bacterium]|nr:sn-glycerol-3-phosphate ABC transporter ATP-binding protein UgpC [Hyphomicrobiales bacterium]